MLLILNNKIYSNVLWFECHAIDRMITFLKRVRHIVINRKFGGFLICNCNSSWLRILTSATAFKSTAKPTFSRPTIFNMKLFKAIVKWPPKNILVKCLKQKSHIRWSSCSQLYLLSSVKWKTSLTSLSFPTNTRLASF